MFERKQWKDLSTKTRAGISVLGIIQFALLAVALWDVTHRSEAEIKGKKQWWIPVLFINYIGPIAYFLFGRRAKIGRSSPAVNT